MWCMRPVTMGIVGRDRMPCAVSSSASPAITPGAVSPPVTRIPPSAKIVAVWNRRGFVKFAAMPKAGIPPKEVQLLGTRESCRPHPDLR